MWKQVRGLTLAVGALCLLANIGFAKPHDDPAHRSALHVTLTLANGARHAATLQGVGCTEAMCSRVRAQDNQADSIWVQYPQAEIKHRFVPAAVRDDRAVRRIWEAEGRKVAPRQEKYMTHSADWCLTYIKCQHPLLNN